MDIVEVMDAAYQKALLEWPMIACSGCLGSGADAYGGDYCPACGGNSEMADPSFSPMRAALSALADAGWVVVPREPTVKMMFAGMDAHYPGKYAYYPEEHESAEAAVNAAYRAMLSAAPAPK